MLAEVGRRQFLRGGTTAAAGAAAAAHDAAARRRRPPPGARVTYPSNRLANLAELKPNEPLDVAYPDAGSRRACCSSSASRCRAASARTATSSASRPSARTRATRSHYDADETGPSNCPGHYSRFDSEKGGLQIWGHATQNLPQFQLRVDDKGDIYAEGVDELIYGRRQQRARVREDEPWPTSATSTGCRSSRRTPRSTTSSATTASSAAATRPTAGT